MPQPFLETLDRIDPADAEALFYEHYDEAIQALCPDYTEMLSLLVDAVPRPAQVVVDLGCGTGTLLEAIGQRRPEIARLVGLDHNADLLSQAREKLADQPEGRVTLLERDLVKADLPEADVFVSSLVLHNLGLIEQIELYHRIARRAGTFLQFESVSGETLEEEEERWTYLRWWMGRIGMPVRLQELAIEHIRDHDRPLALSQHRKLAEAEGLDFRVLNAAPGFAVFTASRRA